MASGLGALTTVWGLLRDSSFAEIDEQIARPARIAVVGASPAERQAIIEALSHGGEVGIVGHDVDSPALEIQLERVGEIVRVRLVTPNDRAADIVDLSSLDPAAIVTVLGPALFDRLPLEAAGLGRRLPALRDLAAAYQIREYALLNAQIAAISNIPDVVPVLGPFIAGVAEMLILTKNQIMMVYKLGATYGRPLGDKKAILAETVTILGAAYVWRLLARQLVGVAPFGLGIVPKVAIAYIGTYVEGRTAQYYFLTGAPPPQELVSRFLAEAKGAAQRVLLRRTRRGASEQTAIVTSAPFDR
ncbi:MAG: hypothetical protein RMM58_00630 [Chloroflexota bacterium]|nr:hypothetical protein [Dehalococcoidia bacterium]MDW8252363.1 hypothetical protein [Chloroflexota bacterium]